MKKLLLAFGSMAIAITITSCTTDSLEDTTSAKTNFQTNNNIQLNDIGDTPNTPPRP